MSKEGSVWDYLSILPFFTKNKKKVKFMTYALNLPYTDSTRHNKTVARRLASS